MHFNFEAGTSRGVLKTKDSWFISIHDPLRNRTGLGEVSIISGLSLESAEEIEEALAQLKKMPHEVCYDFANTYKHLPAFCFSLETALRDLAMSGTRILYQNDFTSGKKSILINGLVWMGTKEQMYNRVKEKIEQGFSCIKLKIGVLKFNEELELISYIRKHYPSRDIEIRVDANGSFAPKDALNKLKLLSDFDIHSIEQPIKQGQRDEMAKLCETSPLDIALDEELIGFHDEASRSELLETIKPKYIILKPSLIGGVQAAENWINLAEGLNIGWWITSALESNIGLNAIAQWVAELNPQMPQGLGTGLLYENNIKSPLVVNGQFLHYVASRNWDFSPIEK